jgi:hypothetical protein
MTHPSSPYSSYLLRLWHSAEGDPQGWRVSLHDLVTGERLGFSTLESLFAFFETAETEVMVEANEWKRKEADDRIEQNTAMED